MIITASSNDFEACNESGDKGYKLYLLSKHAFNVPAWVIIGKSAFNQFLEYSEVKHLIDNALAQITSDLNDQNTIQNASNLIRKVILDAQIPNDLHNEIIKAYDSLQSHQIIVRSSIVNNNDAHSFAGQHVSSDFISDTVKLLESIKECWISTFSYSAINYRLAHKLPIDSKSFEMAVIIQEMIFPLKSGIVTTADLLSGNDSSITINATYGLCSGVQTGIADTDTYKIIKKTERISLLSIVSKNAQAMVNQTITAVEKRPVPDNLKSASCLSYKEIIDLSQLAKTLESKLGFPLIAEWGWTLHSGFYILQVSKITKSEITSEDASLDTTITNDKKIQLTYPLNFGFLRHLCHNSFLQLCKSMHISKKEIQRLDPFLENILSSIFGRTYYNILNLYRLTSVILPGRRARNAYLDFTTGQQGFDKSHFDKYDSSNQSKPISIFRKLFNAISFTWYHFRFKSMMNNFVPYFNDICNKSSTKNFNDMRADEIYRQYAQFEKDIFSHWKAPALNNCLSMVYFKVFRLLTHRWFGINSAQFQKDLLFVNSQTSSQSVTELSKMTEFIRQKDSLNDLNDVSDPDIFYNATLKESTNTHDSIHKKLSVNYGGNNSSGSLQTSNDTVTRKEKKEKAEKLIEAKLSGVKKFIYRKILDLTRQTIQNRIIINNYKTRLYSIVQSMFKGIGVDLHRNGKIENSEDIFYIDFKVFTKVFTDSDREYDLRKIIAHKKEQYVNFSKIDAPSRIITNGPIYWLNQPGNNRKITKTSSTAAIKGTGIGGGVAEGEVCMSYQHQLDCYTNNKKIIVLSGKYPQHILPYHNVHGVIVENSNAYSNIVIVARELGIPVITGVKNISSLIRSGMIVKMNGSNGTVSILENVPKTISEVSKVDELVIY